MSYEGNSYSEDVIGSASQQWLSNKSPVAIIVSEVRRSNLTGLLDLTI
jgi:hypothetical protein